MRATLLGSFLFRCHRTPSGLAIHCNTKGEAMPAASSRAGPTMAVLYHPDRSVCACMRACARSSDVRAPLSRPLIFVRPVAFRWHSPPSRTMSCRGHGACSQVSSLICAFAVGGQDSVIGIVVTWGCSMLWRQMLSNSRCDRTHDSWAPSTAAVSAPHGHRTGNAPLGEYL